MVLPGIEISRQKSRIELFFSAFFASAALILFLLKAYEGLSLLEFGDEAEKFVAAQLIENGDRLYSDVFSHHGPLLYIFSHLYEICIGHGDFSNVRLVMVGLALVSAVAIYFSPALEETASKFLAVGLYLVVLSSIWILQGIHMILYHQVGGFLLVVPVMQLFAPLYLGRLPQKFGVVSSGFFVVLPCFAAYTFGPSALFLTAASAALLFRRSSFEAKEVVLYFFAGALFAVLLVSLWMFCFGDFKGFLIYHFYFNQFIYSQFINYSLRNVVGGLSISFSPSSVIHSFALVLSVLWVGVFCIRLFGRDLRRRCGVHVVALGFFCVFMLFLNPRGAVGFQESAFIVVGLGLSSLAVGILVQRALAMSSICGISTAALVVISSMLVLNKIENFAISTPHGISKADLPKHPVVMRPEQGGAYDFIRNVASGERDVLALVFNPLFYIKTNKLPASGNYYYLPWQALYNKSPVDGYKIDICADIIARKPAVFFFNNWKVWDTYAISDYEPCVPAEIERSYLSVSQNSQLYVRRDLAEKLGIVANMPVQLRPSRPLEAGVDIAISLGGAGIIEDAVVKRIGIMFGTYGRRNAGDAILKLSAGAQEFSKRFPLDGLKDNEYHFFDLPPDRYTNGAISFASGGGVSVWEVQAKALTHACVIYEYDGGRKAFTPGCPLF